MDFLNLAQIEAPNPHLSEIRFTVKPSGELNFKGAPSTDVIEQLMASSDYLASSDRQIQRETNKATERINLLTICFLGSSFIVAIACCFWSVNANHGDVNNNVNREFVRGTYCR
ncbi:hypothetical protein [Nostoc sp.]|uniref:hypothetical protein n=1 Tax=Nostoc sp. TaxID=1180 RepID=UPI002FFC191E